MSSGARVFDTLPFYAKNPETSGVLAFVVGFASLWGMPLLFSLSGSGIFHSLERRTTKELVIERVGRDVIPLAPPPGALQLLFGVEQLATQRLEALLELAHVGIGARHLVHGCLHQQGLGAQGFARRRQ